MTSGGGEHSCVAIGADAVSGAGRTELGGIGGSEASVVRGWGGDSVDGAGAGGSEASTVGGWGGDSDAGAGAVTSLVAAKGSGMIADSLSNA